VQPSQASFQPSPVESDSTAKYAEVAVPLHIFQTFVYRIPSSLVDLASVGARIVVPFGRNVVTGYIVGLPETPLTDQDAYEVKDATQILDSIPVVTAELIELTRWVSEYYGAPWGEVIKAALPPGISPSINQVLALTTKGRDEASRSEDSNSTRGKVLQVLSEQGEVNLSSLAKQLGESATIRAMRDLERSELITRTHRPSTSFVRTKSQRAVRLLEIPGEQLPKLTQTQQKIVDTLRTSGEMTLKDLLSTTGVTATTVNRLAKKGLVEVYVQAFRRDPLAGDGLPSVENHRLTETQIIALNAIKESLRDGVYAPYLLHGVTGSGKTEVYIRAMRLALELGRGALMMVPEIALTPVFSRRLRAHFGDRVAIFHSSLSPGERFDEWTRVRNGDARVVIGTRSAVFAPVQNLGLVVVDEEHESSYRQQESPQYNGRDTAIVRAQKESAVVVLGSATPSLESFHNARAGKYRYLQMPQRIANRPMASATLIDMRQVFDRHKKPRVFSDELLQAIEDTHARGEQAIVLLNRRGYSSFVLCRTCGETIQCPNCDVTLTYHRSERVILCHYCNHRQAAPTKCPSCDGKYIYYVGEGTEQIEEMLKKQFPSLRIARIDRDTTARRRTFEKSLTDFSEGRLDMLVGTQMLAKGHDYPNVTLVGVVSVDLGLALPDFRSAERTFQLLTQVAGRAGRGDRAGQVLIQTYHPHHYALLHASAQDYQGFYDEEIKHRQNLAYPPFVSLASLLIHGTDLGRVRADALLLRKALDRANPDRTCRILGPAPAPLARLKGEHRFQMLVKSRSRRQLRTLADTALKEVAEQGVNLRSIKLEIDPVSVM
jgi:primosomal protein N' (replication factor Y)